MPRYSESRRINDTLGWAAPPLLGRQGSLLAILLPWYIGIRPKPSAFAGTGDRSSSGVAQKMVSPGVDLPRKGHTCCACTTRNRIATNSPFSLNDTNNRLSVIGSYWSIRRFRGLHCGTYALLKLLSSRPPRALSIASATVLLLLELHYHRAVSLCSRPSRHSLSGMSSVSWLSTVLVQPRSTVLTCVLTTSRRGAPPVCFLPQMDQRSVWNGDEESVFPFKSDGQRPSDTERAAPSLETCRSSHFIKMLLRSCLPCSSSCCTAVGASVSMFILPM